MRRRMMMNTKRLVPKEYKVLEYIKNPSNAYIDTGYKPNHLTRVVGSFNDSSIASWTYPFGVLESTRTKNFTFEFYTNWRCYYGTIIQRRIYGSRVNGIVKFDCDKNIIQFNNTTTTLEQQEFQSPLNLYLCGLNNNGTLSARQVVFYDFAIYEDDVLLHKYIPALRKVDNKVGMYDIVSNQFLTSPNGTDFIGG